MSEETTAKAAQAHALLDDLELPKMDLISILKSFGPGIVLMMTGIGTSHLIAAPASGGRFGFALLWCIPVAYILKYYGFELAFRFTHTTGRGLIQAYGTAWKKWPLWYLLVVTIVQCAIGQAGRLVASAAVVYYFVAITTGLELPIGLFAFVIAIFCVTILLKGRYSALERAAKIGAGTLFLTCTGVYLVNPAPLSEMRHFFVFDAPAGSWLIIAAFLGLLPTGMDVSLQASEWGKARRAGVSRIRMRFDKNGITEPFDPIKSTKEDLAFDHALLTPEAREYCRRWYKLSLYDLRVGYVASALVAAIFLLLAAVWLYPSEVEGRAVMGEIAQIFTSSVGPWMMMIFLVSAFAATFSTAFNYFDGWPRVIAASCRNIFPKTASLYGTAKRDLTAEHRSTWYSEYNIYRATMFFSLFASVAIIAGLPRPVLLVLVASAWALLEAPVIFFLNLYYCVTVIPKEDRDYYPSMRVIVLAGVSLVLFTAISVVNLVILVALFFEIPLLGG